MVQTTKPGRLCPTSLIAAFYDAAAALDEKGVSIEGRVAVLNPRQHYELIQGVGSNGLINRDSQGTALQVVTESLKLQASRSTSQ